MTDKKDDSLLEQGRGKAAGDAGTVEDQGTGRQNPHLSTRPRLDAEQAALAARIIGGTAGEGTVSAEARDDLVEHLNAIASYNGD